MAAIIGGERLNLRERKLDVNLESEYDLIMQKKSNLSANDRRRIVSKYERLMNTPAVGVGETNYELYTSELELDQ
jgi:hypothetical protein